MGFDTRRSNGQRFERENVRPPKSPVRCPAEHPSWFLYHKRVEGTVDTVICCRACEGGNGE